MNSSALIFSKLEEFIRKYYTNELIRGSILFVGLGLLYLLFISFVEYFLWLPSNGRIILFWLFVMVEIFLVIRFILYPVSKLFKIKKGINYTEASKIIGNHFSDVNDKLLNFLQLASDLNQSELLLASIEQKARALQPIPFSKAVDFSQNKKVLPLALIPILVLLFFFISGRQELITNSMARVVNYKQHFSPPAPFRFVIKNSLVTEQNKDYVLRVSTIGDVIPNKMMIYIENESYYMENTKSGEFQFVFEKPVSNIPFRIEANEVTSPEYLLQVTTVPAVLNFEMILNFPKYLKRQTEIIKGTGNALVPEGTFITWKMNTSATDEVNFLQEKQKFSFLRQSNTFFLTQKITKDSEYQIVTSNKVLKNYENLSYTIKTVRDLYPTIKVELVPDSLSDNRAYYIGQVADDYGLSKLQIVYYPKNKPLDLKRGIIRVKNDVYDQFVFAFPSNLPIKEGVAYEYYFEVFDNDAIHQFKSSRSAIFTHREATASEKQEQLLENQNKSIQGLEQSLKAQDKQLSELEKIQNTGKQKKELDYKDQQKINDFVKRQKQQEEMMKEFSEKMKENLEKFNPNRKDSEKELLKERLNNVDKESEKNQKLLDELKDLNSKLEQDDLYDKIEKFQQKSKNQTKSLEQLVELTKRYYVEKKAEQLAEKLQQLAVKQEQLSESKTNSEIQQNEINKEFENLKKEFSDLQKQNKELKKPLDLPSQKDKEESINTDLQNASKELQKSAVSKAAVKQKSAAKKMQQMAQSMQMEMQGGEKEQLQEDVKMLRQILDNLLEFSFSEEKLINNFKASNGVSTSFSKHIKAQHDLREQFKHIDDSLFALSLRNPKIEEKITSQVGNVYYHLDKSIDYFNENQIGRGTSSQQYALTSANTLANLLADTLNGMQMSMSGQEQGSPKPGQGQGKGMQLPDIIQKQEGLGKKMQQNGNKPGDQQGSKSGGKSGNQNNGNKSNGNNGEDGEGDAKAVLDILKEQRQLREALEKELQKYGLTGKGQATLDKMKQIEKQLINKGFTQEVIQKALNLKYDLLKLEQAVQEQNQDSNRESNTNKKEFQNNAPALPVKLQEYLNSIEILNRQTLPLRSQFNKRVQDYFKKDDKL